MGGPVEPTGPDLTAGVPLDALREDEPLPGRVGDDAVLLVRSGGALYAVGATCTHYSAPLAEGLVCGGTIRCPWHHARFDLRSGEASRPPAFAPLARWRVEESGDRAFVRERLPEPATAAAAPGPESVVIVGGGAAAFAAADTLRREGYRGPVAILTAEETGPVDRPNLSKEYLAGTAPEEWIPLPLPDGVTLRTATPVTEIDTQGHRVTTAGGDTVPYGALLLATGADAVRLDVPGSGLPHVGTLRTLADSRAMVARAASARGAVVVGGGFIALEAAASLRSRGVAVHVVAPAPPLERVLGSRVSAWVQRLHESRGVVFHLGRRMAAVEEDAVLLDDGARLPADLVVVGVGVRPATDLAARAGIAVDQGILVDENLRTNAEGVFAAGDAARFPHRLSGERIRVEHWVVAQRMGRCAALAMLGRSVAFDAVPFFWSAHGDVTIAYVGHASGSDRLDLHGSLDRRDATLAWRRGDATLAVATVGRDRLCLEAEDAFEHGDLGALAAFGRTR